MISLSHLYIFLAGCLVDLWCPVVCIFTFTHYTPRTSKKIVIEKRNLEKKTISMRSLKLPKIDSVIFLRFFQVHFWPMLFFQLATHKCTNLTGHNTAKSKQTNKQKKIWKKCSLSRHSMDSHWLSTQVLLDILYSVMFPINTENTVFHFILFKVCDWSPLRWCWTNSTNSLKR